jgi:hypothetical protein
MTVTVYQMVYDSLLEIGVVRAGQTLSPEHLSLGIRKLNAMLAEWEEDGIELGYYPQTVQTTNVPVPAAAENAVMLNLAVAQSGAYGVTVTPATVLGAKNGYERLERDTITLVELSVSHLPNAHPGYYDINSDD